MFQKLGRTHAKLIDQLTELPCNTAASEGQHRTSLFSCRSAGTWFLNLHQSTSISAGLTPL